MYDNWLTLNFSHFHGMMCSWDVAPQKFLAVAAPFQISVFFYPSGVVAYVLIVEQEKFVPSFWHMLEYEMNENLTK